MQDLDHEPFLVQATAKRLTTEWKPYENKTPWSIEGYRNRILPPVLTKRHFFFPSINHVGITILDLFIALGFFAAVVRIGIAQRTEAVKVSGSTANLLWIPLFLFITYRSPITWLFGISFERSMFWHGLLSSIVTLFGIWHGLCAMYWGKLGHHRTRVHGLQAFFHGRNQDSFVTGAITCSLLILLTITSFRPIRRVSRRYWLWSHHIFVAIAAVFSVIHGGELVLVGICIYLLDRLFGYVYQAWFQYRKLGEEGMAQVLPSGLVRLSFPRLVSFTAGQYMCIQVPRVSVVEYHAYTIASAPSDAELTFLIQPDGVWSRCLAKDITNAAGDSGQPVQMRALLHGPIGNVGLDWKSGRYQAFILIAGGVGITPMMSIYFDLAEQRRRGRPLAVVQLIWVARSKVFVDDVLQSQVKSRGELFSSNVTEEESFGVVPNMELAVFLTQDADSIKGTGFECQGRRESTVLGSVEWNRGRPNLEELFIRMQETIRLKHLRNVAVLACGSEALTRDVTRVATKCNGNDTQFDIHLEHFC